MRRAIGGLVLLLLCLAGPAEAQAEAAGVAAYRQQLARTLTQRVRNLRHATPGGTVLVRFVVGRDGLVTQSEIEASSGAEATDRLALAIVPVGLRLPPLPAEAPIRSLAVTVPLRFPSREAATPDSVKAYRSELHTLFRRRVSALPHRMPTGGRLFMRFKVETDGTISQSEVAQSSGLKHIDDLGLRIVPVGFKLPPPPDRQPIRITMPLRFFMPP